MNDAKLNNKTEEDIRLHHLPLNERKMKINRKWAMWIVIILLILVVVDGGMMTIIFMMRKGIW